MSTRLIGSEPSPRIAPGTRMLGGPAAEGLPFERNWIKNGIQSVAEIYKFYFMNSL